MSDPINLFEVDGERFPVGGQLLEALRYGRYAFDQAWAALELLSRHVTDTSLGMSTSGGVVTDDELAFHSLALQQLEATFDELRRKLTSVSAANEQRTWNTLMQRGSTGMMALGKTFKCEGDLIPKQPKEDTPEYDAWIAWVEARYPQFLKKRYVGFRDTQRILDDLAAKHQPRPEYISISPDTSVKIK